MRGAVDFYNSYLLTGIIYRRVRQTATMSNRLRNLQGSRLTISQSPPNSPNMELAMVPSMRSFCRRLRPSSASIVGIQERQDSLEKQAIEMVAELQMAVSTLAQQQSPTNSPPCKYKTKKGGSWKLTKQKCKIRRNRMGRKRGRFTYLRMKLVANY